MAEESLTREAVIDQIVNTLDKVHKRWYFAGPRRLVEVILDALGEVEANAKKESEGRESTPD